MLGPMGSGAFLGTDAALVFLSLGTILLKGDGSMNKCCRIFELVAVGVVVARRVKLRRREIHPFLTDVGQLGCFWILVSRFTYHRKRIC